MYKWLPNLSKEVGQASGVGVAGSGPGSLVRTANTAGEDNGTAGAEYRRTCDFGDGERGDGTLPGQTMTNYSDHGTAGELGVLLSGIGSNAVIKRSVRIARHSTSISLEDVFWDALREIATARGLSLNALIAEIDAARSGDDPGNLSSAARVYALQWFRGAAGRG